MIIQASSEATGFSLAALTARDWLFIALGLVTAVYLVALSRAFKALAISVIGFFANFLDALGVGSFATTTSVVRHFRMVPDEQLPGTLNVGYVLPTVAQAFIYTKLVPVDSTTLIALIVSAVLGAWLGAGVVSKWPRRHIQLGMGMALIGCAVIMFLSQPRVNLVPVGGDALALTGTKLIIGIVGNFVLGSLMTIGIGLYAPCMILIYLLGMKPTAAWPIMMGSCAFLMPLASVRFIRAGAYDRSAVVGMALAGIPGVLIAAFIVRSLPLDMVKWLVIVVVTYTAINMLRAARAGRAVTGASAAAEAQPIA